MRQVKGPGGGVALSCLGLIGLALAAGPGCGNPDVSINENTSPVVHPDSAEGKEAMAKAAAFVKVREEQEAKAKARAAKRKKGFPEGEKVEPTPGPN